MRGFFWAVNRLIRSQIIGRQVARLARCLLSGRVAQLERLRLSQGTKGSNSPLVSGLSADELLPGVPL